MKTLLKKNKIIYKIGKFVSLFYHNDLLRLKAELGTFLRKNEIIKYKKFEALKQFENIHKDERCFIVATGPSLTYEDLNKLNSEITLSMNSICMVFDDITWRPTYYGIQDIYVYERLKKIIINSKMKNVFISDLICKKYRPQSDWVQFPLNLLTHANGYKKLETKFSSNAYEVVYDGFTITYSMIQLAVYMGFKEIYLIGADTNYEKDKAHHIKEHGAHDSTYETARDRMIIAYKVAKEYCDSNGIRIFNATHGGMLEVFPRVNLDDVINKRIKE